MEAKVLLRKSMSHFEKHFGPAAEQSRGNKGKQKKKETKKSKAEDLRRSKAEETGRHAEQLLRVFLQKRNGCVRELVPHAILLLLLCT